VMRRGAVAAAGALTLAAAEGCSTAPPPDWGLFQHTEQLQYAPELQVDLAQMTRLEPGVWYRDLAPGIGLSPQPGDSIVIHYTGWLPDGTVFEDSRRSTPIGYRHGRGVVIRGWDHGIPGMRAGGRRLLVIPPELGYGRRRQGPIPPLSTLVFEIELIQVHPR
jgi:FKBP-type peptidyl-prolyl cis-trans isomerase FkpA